MPELPEVHTTVEGLRKVILGKTIESVWSDFHIGSKHGKRKTIKNKRYFVEFRKKTVGAKIKDVERRGKNILINISGEYTIVVHMKMTGHLMVSGYNKEDPFNKYIHFRVSFRDGKEMVLSDMRKFANICITETENLKDHERLKNVGTDALKISEKDFKSKISNKKGWPVKSALMDQSAVAGLGNIYSDEILWKTGVHPLSKADEIPDKKLGDIFKTMKKILRFSIRHGGDSKSDYRNAFGEKGRFQNFHKVYGRKGKKCDKKDCGGIIERMVIKGRSSHFCPVHQKLYS